MDGGAWWAAVHGVAKSWTRLSDFTFTFHFYALEKEMATHSSVLAWRIPGTGEPGGLPSMGSHRVGHDWRDLAAEFEYNIPSDYSKTRNSPLHSYEIHIFISIFKYGKLQQEMLSSGAWRCDMVCSLQNKDSYFLYCFESYNCSLEIFFLRYFDSENG